MGLRNYVLKNNEKPATHFIEVYRGGIAFEELMYFYCNYGWKPDHTTIALFKIRLK